WYATFSHLPSRTGFWIRYTLEAPKPGHGAPYAQIWFARFDPAHPDRTFGVHRKVAIAELREELSPWRLRIGDAELSDRGMKGAVRGAGHAAEWELEWTPAARTYRYLPDVAYVGDWPTTVVLSPHANVAARGTVTVDGERYELSDAPLGQTHLWG